MNQNGRALVEAIHQQARENCLNQTTPASMPSAIPYTELSEASPGEPLGEEWNTYRREVGRWLREGREGQFVLIKGRCILGIYPTWEAAREAGLKRFLLEPFFVHPIRAAEPHLRVRGINFPWPS